jgi:membrane associated rhomboid family serine protease
MRPGNNYHQPGSGLRIGPGYISPVIKYLIIINVVIFFIQTASSIRLTGIFGLTPQLFFREFPNLFFQPITYMFLHAGMFHLLFNMFALWMFGTEIEGRFKSRSFLKFYFLCGIGGAFLALVFNYNMPNPIVGASGAVYGVLAAYWLMFPDRVLYIFFVFPMRVRWAIPLFAVLNFVASGTHVAHLAHLGGALVGFMFIKWDRRWFSPFGWLKRIRHRRQEEKLVKNRRKAENIMQRVDKILDKINDVGLENISREEKKFLEEASQILSNNDKQLK